MSKSKKPTTVKEWEKTCVNLNGALQLSVKNELKLDHEIHKLEDKVEKLEEQLTMSVGVIKYLEMKLERTNPV
jgi:predicted  nucleic acid-binding Zn-ribbon protein